MNIMQTKLDDNTFSSAMCTLKALVSIAFFLSLIWPLELAIINNAIELNIYGHYAHTMATDIVATK